MSRKDSKPKDRSRTTVAELLKYDQPGNTSALPLPVRDFLARYAAGEPVPETAGIDEWWYGDSELLVAVLADMRADIPGGLPESAHDYIQEYLYRLEESTQVHIWNDPDVLRAAYPLMMMCFGEGRWLAGDYPDALAMKATLSRLCTRRELSGFYERYGLKDDQTDRSVMAGSVVQDKPADYVMKAARLLADPRTPAATRETIERAIADLANATDVHVTHPALVERALTIMFESMKKRVRKQTITPNRREAYKQLMGLLKTTEEGK
jgi:hypothetical protein